MSLAGKWKRGKWKPLKSEKYPQGWARPTSKILRKKMKNLDVSNGGSYRKIGGWFEWN